MLKASACKHGRGEDQCEDRGEEQGEDRGEDQGEDRGEQRYISALQAAATAAFEALTAFEAAAPAALAVFAADRQLNVSKVLVVI
ncbi:MAG: hypothetical protein PHG48_00765 [Eubacteriales bacterium]|nr:hypothetical protein [Eubacteriales bacterium]